MESAETSPPEPADGRERVQEAPVPITFPTWTVKTEPETEFNLVIAEDQSCSLQNVIKSEDPEECVELGCSGDVASVSTTSAEECISHTNSTSSISNATDSIFLVVNCSDTSTVGNPQGVADVEGNSSVLQASSAFIQGLNAEIKYQCSACPAAYFNWSKMEKHVKLHEETTFFICKYCNEYFGDDVELSTHFQSHLGDTRFRCAHCDKCFIRKSYFIQHLREHNSDSNVPYKCTRCGNGFTSNTELRLHLKSHSSSYMDRSRREKGSSRFVRQSKLRCLECSVCQKCFMDSNHLEHHMLEHSPQSRR